MPRRLLKEPRVKTIKFRIPKRCICPGCKTRQPFKKQGEYWKIVKEMNLQQPLLLKVRIIRAKCLNPHCEKKSFPLPIPGIEKYARSTERLKTEAIAGIIQDNSTLPRISNRLGRSFNTSGSKSAIDRWKHREADKYSFEEIIPRLGFSGILSIDEYMPRRADNYDLIAGDAIRIRILYIEETPLLYGRGVTESFVKHLDRFGISPWAVIFDLWASYPKQVLKVWPNALIQYDHYHVMQEIHKYLKNALLQFRRSLKGEEWKLHRDELWEHKWNLLKNMDKWGPKEHFLIPEFIEVYKGTIVEKVLIFKERLWDIFDDSSSSEEAQSKRDELYKETWWQSSWHLCQIMDFLMSPKFDYMVTYLDVPGLPRSGQSETIISIWRQMERVRYGFRTNKGKLDHLKLYQISRYLSGKLT